MSWDNNSYFHVLTKSYASKHLVQGRQSVVRYSCFTLKAILAFLRSSTPPPALPSDKGVWKESLEGTVAACGILPDMSWKRVCRGSLRARVLVKLQRERTVSGDHGRGAGPLPTHRPCTFLFDTSGFVWNVVILCSLLCLFILLCGEISSIFTGP